MLSSSLEKIKLKHGREKEIRNKLEQVQAQARKNKNNFNSLSPQRINSLIHAMEKEREENKNKNKLKQSKEKEIEANRLKQEEAERNNFIREKMLKLSEVGYFKQFQNL